MNNEFIIKINRDAQGNEISLSNISIESADALKIFITALSDFAKLYKNPGDLSLSLKEGSITSSLVYPAIGNEIAKDIGSVLAGTSYNNEKIKLFKVIQDKIKQNGLDFSVIHKVDNQSNDVTFHFKSSDFRLRRTRSTVSAKEVRFTSGKLFECGGKTKTNIHLEHNGEVYTIQCTQAQAMELNHYLYRNVYLAVLAVTKEQNENQKPKYHLIDSYLNQQALDDFRSFYLKIKDSPDLNRFDEVHNQIVQWIETEKEKEIIKLMRLYNFSFSDRGIVRTILMALKPVIHKTIPELVFMYDALSATLRSGNRNKLI